MDALDTSDDLLWRSAELRARSVQGPGGDRLGGLAGFLGGGLQQQGRAGALQCPRCARGDHARRDGVGMGGPGHRDRHVPAPFGLVVRQYPADGQGAHRRPVRGSSGETGGLTATAESLDRCGRGRAEASDDRLLLGQVG